MLTVWLHVLGDELVHEHHIEDYRNHKDCCLQVNHPRRMLHIEWHGVVATKLKQPDARSRWLKFTTIPVFWMAYSCIL